MHTHTHNPLLWSVFCLLSVCLPISPACLSVDSLHRLPIIIIMILVVQAKTNPEPPPPPPPLGSSSKEFFITIIISLNYIYYMVSAVVVFQPSYPERTTLLPCRHTTDRFTHFHVNSQQNRSTGMLYCEMAAISGAYIGQCRIIGLGTLTAAFRALIAAHQTAIYCLSRPGSRPLAYID